MVTIVQGSPDLRQQALEQGVGVGVQNFFKVREEERKKKKFVEAFQQVNSAQTYEQAVSGLATLDKDILSNPQALELLSQQIDRKFPAQDAVQVEKDGVVETIATRKGDVSGALAAAQQRGGRLSQDVSLEEERTSKLLKEGIDLDKAALEREKFGYKQGYDAKKLGLEERRTRAAELRAKRTGMRQPTAKEIEIGILHNSLGVPMDRSIRLALDYEKIEIIPETGEVRMTDAIAGKTMIIPQEILDGDPAAIPKPADGKSLWDAAQYATGPFSQLRAAWSLPGNYMGVFVPNKTEEARTQLRMSTQRLVRALANNPRFAATELERIRKELALDPKIYIHPEAMRRRMVVTHQELTLWKAQMDRDASPKSGLPPDQRAQAKASATEIGNFLAQLNVPVEHLHATSKPSAAMPPEAAKSFSPDEWEHLTPEEQQQWLSQF